MQGIHELPNYLLLPSIYDRLAEIEYVMLGNSKKDMPTKLVDIVVGDNGKGKGKKQDTCRQYSSANDFNKSRYGGA